jgi:hypothetical protein
MTTEQKTILAERQAALLAGAKAWAATRFGISPDEITGYNSGAAYDKIWVTNRAAAEKVSAKVAGGTCNGGRFHGMALGGITEYDGHFEVMC